MREIIICEDNRIQREQIKKYIQDYIEIQEYDLKITLLTDKAEEVIRYISEKGIREGIYFLDIKLEDTISGITLGSLIREEDPLGNVILVTAYQEYSSLVFEYKLEAMDYILKEDPDKMKARIRECLDVIIKRRIKQTKSDEDLFKIKNDNGVRFFKQEDILFFSTTNKPHRLQLYIMDSCIEFYGKLKDLEKRNPNFIKCHESIVVNVLNIEEVDRKQRKIVMKTGEAVDVSVRKIKTVMDKLDEIR